MTPYLEIGGDYREILRGIFLIELPLPFSIGLINVYLVRLADGYLLIDCGMDTKPCFAALERALEGIGVPWTDIRQILLTHVHPDHIGLAPRVLQLTGARLSMHADDAAYLDELSAQQEYQTWSNDVLRESGTSEEIIAQISVISDQVSKSFHKLTPDHLLQGGERIPSSIGHLEVLWTPGHSPGHVCLYCRERRVLFAGDQMLEHISPNIGWHPGHDPLAEYLQSLHELARLEIDLVLPSHGAPFTNHRDWIRRTTQHHTDRCARILASLNGAPKTAADLIPALWDRALLPFHYRFAIFEILAHLEHLERQGKVSRIAEDDLVRWQQR